MYNWMLFLMWKYAPFLLAFKKRNFTKIDVFFNSYLAALNAHFITTPTFFLRFSTMQLQQIRGGWRRAEMAVMFL